MSDLWCNFCSRSVWPVYIYGRKISVCRQSYEPEKKKYGTVYTFKGERARSGRKSTVPCVEVKEHIDQHIPYTRGINWWNCIWNEHESCTEVMQEWLKTTENLLFFLNQDMWTAARAKRHYYRSDRNTYRSCCDNSAVSSWSAFIMKKCRRRTDFLYVRN